MIRDGRMFAFGKVIELPFFKSIYLVLATSLALLFAVALVVAVVNFSWTSTAETPAEYVNGIALGLSVLVSLVIAQQHPAGSTGKLFWWVMASGLGVLAANETFDVFELMNRAWADDDYLDLFILCITPFGLYLSCRVQEVPKISLIAMKCGFGLQCLSNFLDLADNGDGSMFGINSGLIETLAELTELVFIEVYLFSLGCLLLSIVARSAESDLLASLRLLPKSGRS